MKLSMSDLELLPGAAVKSRGSVGARRFTGVSSDSRSLRSGNVFFALRGEKFDGHTFALQAAKEGAAAVVVDQEFAVSAALKKLTAVVTVPDTTKALGDLALIYRMKFDIPVIAIGGSNGKTTTKEMVSAVLREKYTVLATEGNLNNHIGVPQMLFRLKPTTEIVVLELGTNHFGELRYLCSVALPTHAVVTNIGREHLEFFGTVDGVAEEETELFRFMQAASGRAYVNLDDARLKKAGAYVSDCVTYGAGANAGVRAEKISLDARGCASFECTIDRKAMTRRRIQLGAAGMHNVSNALAAIAVGASFGVPPASMARALGAFTSASKRMEIVRRKNGVTILNDTYNANPDSVQAALETLMAIASAGKKIAVLGDMFELGASAEEEHRQVGRMVRAAKPDVLVTVGVLARQIREAARLKRSYHCETKDEAADILQRIMAEGDAVLVKGSRGMAMEQIVARL
jgi:UDP-N-acetylmuramoyl-tripeptide--D-alanyl-D-alanine ligase